jgi:hypothetical protein
MPKKTLTKSGQLGAAQYETKIKADGTAIVRAPKSPLPFAVEQLIELDEQAHRLTWTSSFTPDPGQEDFVGTLAPILAAGTNQIATSVGVG